MHDLRALWRRALAPEEEFRSLAGNEPRPLASFGGLMALRAPVAFVELLLTYFGFRRMYQSIAAVKGTLWDLVLWRLSGDVTAEDIRALMQDLPPVPALERVLPWLLLAAPLYVISVWFHDAMWDHGCLWMLGGLKERRGFRTTLVAESEALQVGVFGAALALLSNLPRIGWILALPLGFVGAYFWVLRGFALAAFHRCPVWKGIVATVLHVVLAACFVLGFLALLFVLLAQGLA